ncbi:MAG: GGDEF domain-containing protein [Campylobacterota bacterium]
MNNILLSNIKTEDSRLFRRLILLNSFLMLGVIVVAFFAILNYFVLREYTISIINTLVTLLGIGVFLDLSYNKNIDRAITITLTVMISFFILFIYLNENRGFGLFWVPVVPILAIGLVGFKKGALISIIYFIPIFTMAYLGIGEWLDGQWSLIGFFRLILSSLLVMYIVVMMDIALEESYKKLEKLSSTDPLTLVHNRRKIEEILSREIGLSKRYDKQLALILFDIDDFKKINDMLGHNGGDKVLQKIAKEIKASIRESDYIGRWGGEEFLIVIPEIDHESVKVMTEKIRILVQEMGCSTINNITCSFGITLLDKESDSIESLINKADIAMYRAKEKGKNCIVSY